MGDARSDCGAREEILARVRAAVQKTAPKKETRFQSAIFPAVDGDLAERFQAESAANFVEVKRTGKATESAAALKEVLDSLPEGEVWMQDVPEIRELIANAGVNRAVQWSNTSGPAESSRATVTLCEALVAMTGSIMVSSGGCAGRGSSLVAPCHVVFARVAQLIPDLQSALAQARTIAFDNSFIGLITGCSRTSDIEKKLVIGAHGPMRVVVILQD